MHGDVMENPKFDAGDKVIVQFPHSRMPGVIVGQETSGSKPVTVGGQYRYRVDVAPDGKPCVGAFALESQITLVEKF